MSFLEAALILIKHKDIMRRSITDITPIDDTSAKIATKTDTYTLIAQKNLEITRDGHYFCDNTRANVQALVEIWPKINENPKIKVTFLDEQQGVNWSVSPITHSKIVDVKNIQKSLMTLFEGSY